MKPILQLALDFVDLKRALKNAEAGMAGGADWLEAGTPLIKSEGLHSVRELRRLFPKATIVADMKIMDAGRTEVETAAKAGANIVDVLGASSDATIRECIQAGKNYGAKIVVDMIAVEDVLSRAKQVEDFGADYVTVHCAIDEQMEGKDPFEVLRKVAEALTIPVGVAGGINTETAAKAVEAGAAIVIVGGAISKAMDPQQATRDIRKGLDTGKSISTTLFKRKGEAQIREILELVSSANLSDALHRGGVLQGIRPVFSGIRMFDRFSDIDGCHDLTFADTVSTANIDYYDIEFCCAGFFLLDADDFWFWKLGTLFDKTGAHKALFRIHTPGFVQRLDDI